MPASVLLAYPASSSSRAKPIAARLRALGYRIHHQCVRAREPKRSVALQAHQRVIVLWSRAAARSPLARLAVRARALGKLALISMDCSAPPAAIGGAERRPWGPAQARRWRHIVGCEKEAEGRKTVTVAMTERQTREGSRWHAALAALAIASVAGVAAYVADAAFAGRVNSFVLQINPGASAAVNASGE